MPYPTVSVTDPVGPVDADAIVLGHSLGTSAELWRAAADILKERWRVVFWELPGHGSTAPAASSFRVEDVTDAVIARLDRLGIERFHHAGVSVGGCVGLDLAVRYPSRLTTTVVISAAAKVDSPPFWDERAAGVREHGTASIVEASRGRWFAPQTGSEIVDATLGLLADTDAESYAYAAEALAAFDVSEQLASVAVPVLAVAGKYDQAVPPSRSEALASQLRSGSYAEIQNAAHASPAEQPAAVALVIGRFISVA